MHHNPTPTFLGVTYDRQLTFIKHTETVARKMATRARAIRKLAHTDWGYDKATLRNTYIATARTVAEYAAPAWIPWISPTNLEKLEASQRYAARAITGLLKTTPSDAVLIESDLPSIKTRATQLAIYAYDKSLRVPDDNPRRLVAGRHPTRRTKKTDWRDHARDRWATVFVNAQGDQDPFPQLRAPWEEITAMTFAKAAEGRYQQPEDNYAATVSALNKDADVFQLTCFTDGSARTGNTAGGAGVLMIHRESGETWEQSLPAGSWTSSFQAEMIAIEAALKMATERCEPGTPIRLVTDSLSSHQRLQTMEHEFKLKTTTEASIRELLTTLEDKQVAVEVLWVPSHCGVPGNERADQLAAAGGGMEQGGAPRHFATAKAAIRRATRSHRIHADKRKNLYADNEDNTIFPRDQNLNRQEQVTISRLRSGHHPELRYWRKKMGLTESEECRLCGTGDAETAEHVLTKCPAMTALYPDGWTHKDLLTSPKEALNIWSEWLEAVSPDTA
ncbi:uncharacterized protein LOC133472409 isoform X1 [Phyllopteryx taeniolatus]|uniref:uncharacterized protein LOC133472409 isoform X1 n=1 Tax=Phyllopteryx taeniolatus TaxID=161469 RepID=UPI002AD1F6A4|nr:uncharacterized protein LOC133472409 isoform X1 [Phyllopteryx taeniolatus]XP_061619115.1 uncharacterized protein LOC133472409 isoform X1 [Phyllopteryx taeniolatus]XP_061619116.1 uncharacterized protein LOC133472409 isoform X1 [Phyllopteryx taeniolatus]XP_061619117.1 uncharacterized protein LOC133472409 isoform X1 [Phyllopteryx taeniolatus]XP_061619118.1 uncharacterized protein LOC133472409 isoform X1 [Phyllopteryx taeniolatus]XP_061619119.1 uncharacterized protein LOC133472409 isoform X1 [P